MRITAFESIQEIRAKGARPPRAFADCGWWPDDAHIDRSLFRRPDGPDGAGLERMQHLRLERQLQVANLIEEQRSAIGFDEEPRTRRVRPSERTTHVARTTRSRAAAPAVPHS